MPIRRTRSKRFDASQRRNRLQAVVSGRGAPGALTMDSDATLSLADVEAGAALALPGRGHGFAYLISGAGSVGGRAVAAGDQVRWRDEEGLVLTANALTRLVVVEA